MKMSRIAYGRNWLWLWLPALSVAFAAGSAGAEDSRTVAGEVHWWRDLRTAAAAAKRHGKPLFVEISASWCGYCRRLKAETLRDRSVVTHLRECFVPVEIDADRQAALVEAVGIEGLPTMLIVDPDMNVLQRITGYRSAAQLDATLAQVCRHVRRPAAAGGRPGTTGHARSERAAPAPPRPEIPGGETVPQSRPVGGAGERGAAAGARADSKSTAVAFQGYCLVSMLEEEVLRRGRPEFGVVHRGQTLWFHSLEARRRFVADPERYWPVADGADIVAYVERGERRAADPRLTLVYKGRLWFFADRAAQAAFVNDPERYVQRIVASAPR